jgi:hypothetical protein
VASRSPPHGHPSGAVLLRRTSRGICGLTATRSGMSTYAVTTRSDQRRDRSRVRLGRQEHASVESPVAIRPFPVVWRWTGQTLATAPKAAVTNPWRNSDSSRGRDGFSRVLYPTGPRSARRRASSVLAAGSRSRTSSASASAATRTLGVGLGAWVRTNRSRRRRGS